MSSFVRVVLNLSDVRPTIRFSESRTTLLLSEKPSVTEPTILLRPFLIQVFLSMADMCFVSTLSTIWMTAVMKFR